MTVRDLREKYLAFFESKGHRRFPSGSLIPIDVTGKLDESLLFNGAGMIQFKPYFRGVATPEWPKLATVQKCVRTNDIDEVGDATHLSFFEMLGNFSFGDYFKNQAIDYSWEFLTSPEWLGLDPKRLAFTVYETDDDAYDAWSLHLRGAGIDPETRVFRLDEETNYWPAGAFSKGPPGPCGPNSEMFYWTADTEAPLSSPRVTTQDDANAATGDERGVGGRAQHTQAPLSSPRAPTQAAASLPTGDERGVGGRARYTKRDFLQDDAAGNWVEIWNDVFIQYEWQGHPDPGGKGYVKDAMPELPFRSIDTGMGLDRTAFVLAGKKSVYENGSFDGVFRILKDLTGDDLDYATDPTPKGQAARIVADHVRNAVFCISDGIRPDNNGRGYVVRRLIRRAVLKGQRTLGLSDPFLYKAFEGVVETMGDFYTELEERRATIVETLRNEEEAFRRTLSKGTELLLERLNEIAAPAAVASQKALDRFNEPYMKIAQKAIQSLSGSETIQQTMKSLDGKLAYQLYGTFGFPLEVTQELAAEAGVSVDIEGYEQALKADQALSRGAQGEKSAYGDVKLADEQAVEDAPAATLFTGYHTTEGAGRIVRIRKASPSPEGEGRVGVGNANENPTSPLTTLLVALDQTPFYAASGGQTGDTGTLTIDGQTFHVEDTVKEGSTFWHRLTGTPGDPPGNLLNQTTTLRVDKARRRKIQRNHTATHLLQAALRETLGSHVAQAGSYVGPDRLRFDFAHGKALTPQELETVERKVVERILANEDVTTYQDLPIAEAKARGAMALFGEKYGDKVRMVEVGEFSRELCGGIHVRTAGEIGPFRIVSESSAAGGVRRIEAVTGEAAYELSRTEAQRIREAANLLKASPNDLVQAVERTLEAAREANRKREKAERSALGGASIPGGISPITEFNGLKLWTRDFGDVDPKIAAAAVDGAAAEAPDQVTLAAVTAGGKVQFIAKAGPDAVKKGAHAGNLLREVSKIASGGGGGRAEFATAGGKDPSKIAEALAAAEAILRAQTAIA